MRVVLVILALGLFGLGGGVSARAEEPRIPTLSSVSAIKIFHVLGPEREQVCEPALESVRWAGTTADDTSRFTIEGESAQGYDFINLVEYRENFFGDGEIALFAISRVTSHFQYTWIIVPPPEEVESVRARLAKVMSESGGFDSIIQEFPHVGAGQTGPFPTANLSAFGAAEPPKFKARLFDTSDTPLYAGWYTEPYLIRRAGRTYVAALSINNLEGPTAAVFRPERDGTLTPLCAIYVPSARIQYESSDDPIDPGCPVAVGEGGWPVDKGGREQPDDEPLPAADSGLYHSASLIRARNGGVHIALRGGAGRYVVTRILALDGDDLAQIRENQKNDDNPLAGMDFENRLASDTSTEELFVWHGDLYLGRYAGTKIRDDDPQPMMEYVDIDDGGTLVCRFVPRIIPPPGVKTAP